MKGKPPQTHIIHPQYVASKRNLLLMSFCPFLIGSVIIIPEVSFSQNFILTPSVDIPSLDLNTIILLSILTKTKWWFSKCSFQLHCYIVFIRLDGESDEMQRWNLCMANLLQM